jgi:lysophospholipase L1-like esterase
VTVTGVSTPSQAVTYTAPTVTDGAAPVNVTCAPESGASFPLGTTPVSCGARDAMTRQATCAFTVTLKGMAIGVKKYEALGDSITEGQNGEPDPRFVDPPNSFPTKLQAALDAAYPGQGTAVINRGAGGAPMDSILQNLLKYVTADKPDAVLLEGGYNELLGDCGTGPANATPCSEAIDRVRLGFRDCIRRAKEAPRSVPYVFVATLTPPGPLQSGAQRDRRISNDAIVRANDRVKQVASSEGAIVVDIYPVFLGHEAEYVDTDGLHLRPAGYQAMADAFFAAIQRSIPQTPLFGFTASR